MVTGALRPPTCPLIPVEVGRPSENPLSGAWQVAQATVPSADSRGSKYSALPRLIVSAVNGLSGGIYAASSCRPNGILSLYASPASLVVAERPAVMQNSVVTMSTPLARRRMLSLQDLLRPLCVCRTGSDEITFIRATLPLDHFGVPI